jgi:lipoprotein-anchoring transpeptidase ErfK/SrfK
LVDPQICVLLGKRAQASRLRLTPTIRSGCNGSLQGGTSSDDYNPPMPHAICFCYGFAIHGTNDISGLGGPASHGCVRLRTAHASTLFALVARSGTGNTRIEIY